MAVQIKKKGLNLLSLVEKLFTPEESNGGIASQASHMFHDGMRLVTTPTQFLIQADDGKSWVTLAGAKMKLDTVELAIKGGIGTAPKNSIKGKLKQLYHEAYEQYLQAQMNKPPIIGEEDKKPYLLASDPAVYEATMAALELSSGGKIAAIKKFRTMTGCGLKEAKDQVEMWIDWLKDEDEDKDTKFAKMYGKTPDGKTEKNFMSIDDIPKDAKVVFDLGSQDNTQIWQNVGEPKQLLVPAKDADHLHQPVKGTSAGSIYHVIALSDDVVVSARIRQNFSTAIRAEVKVHHATTFAQKFVHKAKRAGMKKASGGHYSLHLEPENGEMATKAVGAILFALNCQFAAVSTDIESLVGAGK